MSDEAALAQASRGTEGVFIVLPPMFDPAPGFPEVRALITTLRAALLDARPGKVVCLSTIGAQANRPNLLSQLGLTEQALGDRVRRALRFYAGAVCPLSPSRSAAIRAAAFFQP